MDHPHIIRLYEIYESEYEFYLVLEYCAGGELFDHIVSKDVLYEHEAAIVMRQMMSAVAHCHANSVVHRDLKPENFMLYDRDDITRIKLIDFGIAKKLKEGEKLKELKGTVKPLINLLAFLHCSRSFRWRLWDRSRLVVLRSYIVYDAHRRTSL